MSVLKWERGDTDDVRDIVADSRYVDGARYEIGPDSKGQWSMTLLYSARRPDGPQVVWKPFPTLEEAQEEAQQHDAGYAHQCE